MKRLTLKISLILVLMSLGLLFAESVNLTSSAFKVNTRSNQSTEIIFELPEFNLENISQANQIFSRINMNDIEKTTKEGLPEIPFFTVNIAVPFDSQIQLVSQSVLKKESKNNVLLYPSQGDEDSRKAFIYDNKFYNTDTQYPAQMCKVSDISVIRDYAIVNVMVQPFIYNAKSKTLEINKEIRLVIAHNTRSGNGQYQLNSKISSAFEPMYKASIANYDQIRADYVIYQQPTLLIIYPTNTNAAYLTELNKLVNWKKQKGFNVVTATGTDIGSTTTSIKNYIQNAFDTWENKPEYIMLIGDASAGAGFQIPTYDIAYGGFSHYGGAGDYQYTFLSGDDFYGDAIIGRMSIASVTDFQVMVSKVLLYERAPTSEGTSWMNQNLLVGDTSPSGYSCVIMNKYVKGLKEEYDPAHSYTELYGADPSPTSMQTAISSGVLTFNYRGWIGMSGFTESNVNALTNVKKLCNAVLITCSTGGFSSSSMIEAIVRAGTATEPKGAITSVGMSTSGTHTAYNNCLMGGIFHAMYKKDITTMGGAMLYTKHFIHHVYGQSEIDAAKTFSQWLNLMGDPTVNIYRTVPKTFNIQYPASVPVGTNNVTIVVRDQDNQPVKNAWVSITQSNNPIGFYVTDESGVATLSIPAELSTQLTLVVSHQDFITKMQYIQQDAATTVSLSDYLITDTPGGNNNQQINPGETIKFNMNIKNYTDSAQTGLTLKLRSNNPYVSISDSTATIASINAGSIVNLTDEFTFTVAEDYQNGMPLVFSLLVQSGNTTWSSMIFETVKAADLDIQSMTVANTSGVVAIGTPSNIHFTIKNNGSIPINAANAVLKSKSLFLQVIDSLGTFGTINENMTANNQGDPFTVQALTGIYPGVKLKAELSFYNASGYEETEEVLIQVGSIQATDPVPPDEYGYVVYDVTDTGYDDAPEYNWIEVSTIGTALDLNDTGENNDKVTTVDLPFPFIMYGESYNQVSVCSNGWISLGATEQANFRNMPLPGPLAPRPMIAPYWNDLKKSGTNSGVYVYYNSQEHIYVIQWNNMVTLSDNQAVTFQVILYDPVHFATPLGDGPFKFQYHTFHPGSQGTETAPNNYISCGIQDHTATRGVTYTYNNQYAPGAAPLASNSALYFTHPFFLNEAPYMVANAPVIHDQNGNHVVESGETVNIGLPLLNVGLTTAHNVSVTLMTANPYITFTTPTADYVNIDPSQNATNTNYFSLHVSPDCPNNSTINIIAEVNCEEGQWIRSFSFNVSRPSISYRSYLINDLAGNGNGILESGEQAKLVVNLFNSTNLNINNANITISSSDPHITITQNHSNIPLMLANSSYQNVFEFQLVSNITEQISIPVHAVVTSNNAPVLNFDIMLGVNQSGALLQETFNTWLPAGWTIQQYSNNWSHSQTNLAGGLAPEVKFSGDPAFNGLTRLVSTTMDTSDISSIVLSYKQKINVNAPGTTIGVATSAMYSPWHVVWSETLTGSVEAETKNIPINNNDLNKPNFQVCFFIDGPAGNISEWYIDDVTVQTAIGNTAKMTGQVEIDLENYDLRQITVKANEYSAIPDSLGNYELYLIPGTYTTLTAVAPFTVSNSQNNITLTSGQVVNDVNYQLHYLSNPQNLSAQMNTQNHTVALHWNHNLPQNSPLVLSNYDIYRQVNSGNFDFLTTTTEATYSEVLNTSLRYRYYVVAHYTIGVSDSSNVLYVDPNMVSGEDTPEQPIQFGLGQNYPNPFNPVTNIAFSIPENSQVKLSVYNVKGQLVKQLKNERMNKGHYTVQWNGLNDNNKTVGSGIYFIRLNTDTHSSIKKALLLK